MVESTEDGADPWGKDIQQAIDARVRLINSGQYAKLNENVLRSRFLSWLDQARQDPHSDVDVEGLSEIDTLTCRRFAQHLHELVDDGEIAASTAHRDFAVVRAFLNWCVDDERLDRNPAAPNRASDPLPEDPGKTDQQFWTPEQRDQLLRFVDDRADQAFDEDSDVDIREAQRDRALVYLLAYSGVRIGEIVRDPMDDRRQGLRWEHVDLEDGIAQVFGKTREWQTIPLSTATVERLQRYRRAMDPATEQWPLFSTRHAPTVSRYVREAVTDDVDALLEDASIYEIARERKVTLPAITTNGARSVLKRLCDAAEVEVESYLKPHGGRRAAGHALYQQASAEDAQELLRHQSVETTHRAYTDERTAETRDVLDEVFDPDNSGA